MARNILPTEVIHKNMHDIRQRIFRLAFAQEHCKHMQTKAERRRLSWLE